MIRLLARFFALILLALALAGCARTAGARRGPTPLATADSATSTSTTLLAPAAVETTPTVVATVDRTGTIPAAPLARDPTPPSGGLTLKVSPDHGVVGSGVQIEGSIAPDLRPSTEVWVEFWPDGPHKSLGDEAHTKYTGPIWPSRWPVHPGSDGHFTLEVVKVPRVIQTASGDLWLIEPGAHDFALVLDARHAAFAPFQVDAPPPPPTALPAPTIRFDHLWLADARTGWLTGTRCQESLPPTPDANGNIPGPPPPQCEGLIVATTDGGQSWQEQYRGDVEVGQIQFVGRKDGWALGLKGNECADMACPSALLRTTDGGAHWTEVFTTTLKNPTIAFTSPTAGWIVGLACPVGTTSTGCSGYLLTTANGGQAWRETTLPIAGEALSLVHPTVSDGWIISRNFGPGPSKLIVTHDGGKTWQTLSDPAGPGFGYEQILLFRTANRGWLLAGGQPGAGQQMKALFTTKDGGRTWTRLASTNRPGQPALGATLGSLSIGGYVGPMTSSTDHDIWIVSARGGLLHSADGGKTWQNAPIDASYFVDAHFADPQNGWALSVEDPGLWATSDGGKTWRSIALPSGGAP